MTRDWIELSDNERSLVAKEIYTNPSVLNQMEGDIHKKELVKLGHRSCMVDVPLIELISCLWRKDLDTTACCQCYDPSKQESYVQFLTMDDGAKFIAILEEAKFDCSSKPQDLPAETELGTVNIHSSIVFFNCQDIAAITEHLG